VHKFTGLFGRHSGISTVGRRHGAAVAAWGAFSCAGFHYMMPLDAGLTELLGKINSIFYK